MADSVPIGPSAAPIPARVLIVEDEPIVAMQLEDQLRRYGYRIAGVSRCAADALRCAQETEVDVALLDVNLQGPRDGIELAADLCELGLPCVFLTAHGDERTLRRINAVGGQGYLLKPFDERLLHLTLDTALHRHAAERARLEAERVRQRAAAFQAAVLGRSPDALVVLEPGGSVELANNAARELLGVELGDRLDELAGCLLLPAMRVGEDRIMRVEARGAGGDRFPAEVRAARVELAEGARAVLIIRDLSEREALERELDEARKLEVAGRLALGVAHDLNNLLSVVGISTYLLPEAESDERALLCDDLRAAVELGTALTNRLLSLARRPQGEARELGINAALRGVVNLVRRLLGESVDLRFELDPRAGAVRINPIQLDQIILNLVVNAGHAMPDGGCLVVRTIPTNDRVSIEVEDSGVGMSEQLRERVFEPFFSTRTGAGGTGLGLAIVKRVIEDAGGELSLDTSPGRGSCFRVSLPRSGEESQERPADSERNPRSEPHGLGRTALVVDDDPLHLQSLVRLLGSWGFETLACRGAGEALLIAERSSADLSFAIVDREMPYMDGIELCTRLRELRPGLPLLLSSASSGTAEVEIVLSKPLDPLVLSRALAGLFGPQPTGLGKS